MIVVDTNVLSEEMKATPEASVDAWFRRQSSKALFTTTICEGEILLGVALLPDGQRKMALGAAAQKIFALFTARILTFDSAAAACYANIVAERQRLGRPIDDFDAQIAAIARSCGFAIATRNVADFEGIGLSIVNPWVGS